MEAQEEREIEPVKQNLRKRRELLPRKQLKRLQSVLDVPRRRKIRRRKPKRKRKMMKNQMTVKMLLMKKRRTSRYV